MDYFKNVPSTIEKKFISDYCESRSLVEPLKPDESAAFVAYRNSPEGQAAFQSLYDSAPIHGENLEQ